MFLQKFEVRYEPALGPGETRAKIEIGGFFEVKDFQTARNLVDTLTEYMDKFADEEATRKKDKSD